MIAKSFWCARERFNWIPSQSMQTADISFFSFSLLLSFQTCYLRAFGDLCGWHVNRKDVTKWRILEFSRNLFQCFFFEVQTETAKTVQRQLHILHNISKFRHFVISSHLFYWHANHINLETYSMTWSWHQNMNSWILVQNVL